MRLLWRFNKLNLTKNNLGYYSRTINIEAFLFPSWLGLYFFSLLHRLCTSTTLVIDCLEFRASWLWAYFSFFFLNRGLFILLILGWKFSSFTTQHKCLLGGIFSDPLQKNKFLPHPLAQLPCFFCHDSIRDTNNHFTC